MKKSRVSRKLAVMMTPQQIEELRLRMETEREACRKEIIRLEKSAAPVAPDNALGRLTRMESLNDRGVSGAALENQKQKLFQLDRALEKVGTAGFGLCATCRQPIPLARLLALPESTRCVRCASA